MIVYILIILLFAISFIPKIRNYNRLRILNEKLDDFKFANLILQVWILLGFFTRLDFNQMWGCVIYFGKAFDYNNIGFLSLSFALILTARFIKNKRTINLLLTIEFGIWLFRYIYYKGGYATGLTGHYPLDTIVVYDSIAIILRLITLKSNNRLTTFKTSWILTISIMLISIKIFIFPMPHDLFWETKRIQEKTESTKSLLIGNWTGTVKYDSTWLDTIAKYRLDTISDEIKNSFEFGADRTQIDSTHKFAFKEMSKSITDTSSISIEHDMIVSPKSPDCKMDFNYFDWGDLIQNDSLHYGSFKIWKLDSDSLIITMTKGFGTNYKYKLIRK